MRAANPFRPRSRTGVAEAVERIKGWTRQALGLAETTVVSVLELPCQAPGCPPTSTVILILEDPKSARRTMVHGAIGEVGEADVRAAWAAAGPDGQL